jgi:hypothetical protein
VTIRRAEVAERRLQRLEDRYRRAQLAVAAAKARYRTLSETSAATPTQLLYAQRCVDEAHRYLIDLQTAIEYTEDVLLRPKTWVSSESIRFSTHGRPATGEWFFPRC